ncbi:MAG: ABC transporter ATP-binding protein [Candidatus Omnitrophota bacterium]
MILAARNLHKIYRTGSRGLHVINGINLDIECGKMISIIGHSGAGKSTLLHLLAGLDKPSEGEVALEGTSLYKLNDTELARIRNEAFGFVFQFYHLLPEFTALENVLLPAIVAGKNRMHARETAKDILKKLGLEDRSEHKPSQLSGGEQQRVAIARALVNEPKVLFCDEPTGNLDSQTGAAIIDLLISLNKNTKKTIVVVTHEPEIAKRADEVLRIKDGVLAKEGTWH